ncbi:MAG: ion channel [Myxococcota bacterium]
MHGAPSPWLGDLYHWYLRASWAGAVGAIVAAYLLANAGFALAYAGVGGVANLPPGDLPAAFFFSVQTMGTIGYGAMYPATVPAHLLVVGESVVGLLLTALSTGLVFAKFSQPQGRIVFSDSVCVSDHDGRPTLMIRLGNSRGNRVLEANVRLDATLSTVTAEGRPFYRMLELTPVRARIPALSRSFSIMHVLDERSPLFGLTRTSADGWELELLVTLTGLDDTTGQTIHGQRVYEVDAIRFGHRFADVLSTAPDGSLVLDVSRFHDVEPA